jgi:hypothetical protein
MNKLNHKSRGQKRRTPQNHPLKLQRSLNAICLKRSKILFFRSTIEIKMNQMKTLQILIKKNQVSRIKMNSKTKT